MNRLGLYTALGLALVTGLLFGICPELDLRLVALFYDAGKQFLSDKIRHPGRNAGSWREPPALALAVAACIRPVRAQATKFRISEIVLDAVPIIGLYP